MTVGIMKAPKKKTKAKFFIVGYQTGSIKRLKVGAKANTGTVEPQLSDHRRDQLIWWSLRGGRLGEFQLLHTAIVNKLTSIINKVIKTLKWIIRDIFNANIYLLLNLIVDNII